MRWCLQKKDLSIFAPILKVTSKIPSQLGHLETMRPHNPFAQTQVNIVTYVSRMKTWAGCGGRSRQWKPKSWCLWRP